MEIPPIHLPAATLFHVGPLPVTNTMLLGGIGVAVMLMILISAAMQLRAGKQNRFTGFVQWVFEGMYSNIYTIIPDKKIAASIAPLALTIFFTVLCTYWISIMPGVGSIKLNGHELLRGLPTDLNFTTAIAVIMMLDGIYLYCHHRDDRDSSRKIKICRQAAQQFMSIELYRADTGNDTDPVGTKDCEKDSEC